jgi:hypothetical protein
MLFMVIERFRDNDMVPIYQKLRDDGRMLPEGLRYIDSWIEPNFSRCFQLLECDDLRLFQEWVLQWRLRSHDRDRARGSQQEHPRSGSAAPRHSMRRQVPVNAIDANVEGTTPSAPVRARG